MFGGVLGKVRDLIFWIAFSPLLASPAWAESIRLCVDDRPWLPYTTPEHGVSGSMPLLIGMAAQEMGLRVDYEVLPWMRCQGNVRSGRLDALVGAGFVPLNRILAEFPMRGEAVDNRRSLGSARVILARRMAGGESKAGRAALCAKPVGVPLGTQIILDELHKRGCQVDTGAKTDEQNIQKLLLRRVDLIAGYENDIQSLVDARYKTKVEILPEPLFEAHYYLAFSKQYYAANQAQVEALWSRIAQIKVSEAYLQQLQGK